VPTWTNSLRLEKTEELTMPRTVTMAVHLPASAARLYRMYLNPKQHAAFTARPVTIAPRVGAPFRRLAER